MTIVCKICNLECETLKSLSAHLRLHVNSSEISSSEEYYEKFIGRESCHTCGHPTKYLGLTRGFSSHCSHKCAANNLDVKMKMVTGQRKTIMDRFGVNHISKIPGFGDKVKRTKLIRHGSTGWNNQVKIVETCREKFGVDYASQSPEIQEKIKSTCIEKFGVSTPLNLKNAQEKAKRTNLQKYGSEFRIQNPDQLELLIKASSDGGRYRKRFFHGIAVQSRFEIQFVEEQLSKGFFIENGPRLSYVFNGKIYSYFVDFIVHSSAGTRLVEVKGRHKWYLDELQTGRLLAKVNAAQTYSRQQGYLPFKMWFRKETI